MNMNWQCVTLLVLLDAVDHAILLKRLTCDFGIPGKAWEWFSSYLSGRSQRGLFAGLLQIGLIWVLVLNRQLPRPASVCELCVLTHLTNFQDEIFGYCQFDVNFCASAASRRGSICLLPDHCLSVKPRIPQNISAGYTPENKQPVIAL